MEYERHGVVVLGISTDTEASHRKFAEKFALNFPLLADVKGKMSKAYGVSKSLAPLVLTSRRVSFLIDESGIIKKIWDPVKAAEHNEQVLAYLDGRA